MRFGQFRAAYILNMSGGYSSDFFNQCFLCIKGIWLQTCLVLLFLSSKSDALDELLTNRGYLYDLLVLR